MVGGHGLQSRLFEFAWSEPALEIMFRIPYARVLSDWSPLVRRLGAELENAPESLSIIWP